MEILSPGAMIAEGVPGTFLRPSWKREALPPYVTIDLVQCSVHAGKVKVT